MNNPPVITIITVTLNAVRQFEITARSVMEQNYPAVEWIVIDGGSTDGTVELIQQKSRHISLWISEPDRGLFDAMNKGVALATGEWVNFMNAGDTFMTPSTISEIFSGGDPGTDVVYGDCVIRYPHMMALKRAGVPSSLSSGMGFCHQSVFVRTPLLRQYPFDLRYRIGSDYDQFARMFRDNVQFAHVRIPVALYDIGGDSNLRMVHSAREHYRIAAMRFRLTWKEHLHHRFFILKVSVLSFVYQNFPEKFVLWLKNRLISLTSETYTP